MKKQLAHMINVSLIIIGITHLCTHAGADDGPFPTGSQNSSTVEFCTSDRLILCAHNFVDADSIPTQLVITKVDANDFSILSTYTIPDQTAVSIAYVQSSDRIYYLNDALETLVEYDCSTQLIVQSAPIGSWPNSITISPDGLYIFVTSGDYPKYDGDFSDPATWDTRRGKIVKYDLATFAQLAQQTTYSGPIAPVINSSGTRLYLSNSVDFKTHTGSPLKALIDEVYRVEVFSTADLGLIREFDCGHPTFGEPNYDKMIIGGHTEFGHYPLLVDIALDQTVQIDTSTLGEHLDDDSCLSTSPTINKAYILTTMRGGEPACSVAIVDLSTLNVQPHVLEWDVDFTRIYIDELGDQLILWSKRENALYSVSPLP